MKNYTVEESLDIEARYKDKFGDYLPNLTQMNPDYILEVAESALKSGRKIPKDFNWYASIPKGAVS